MLVHTQPTGSYVMRVTASEYYLQQIQQVQRKLDQAFRKLKRVQRTERKEREKLRKQIKHLVDELTDLKYRAAFTPQGQIIITRRMI